MSKVQAVRCDLGGEFRSEDETMAAEVNGVPLDFCEEHGQSHTAVQLVAAAAQVYADQHPAPAETEPGAGGVQDP